MPGASPRVFNEHHHVACHFAKKKKKDQGACAQWPENNGLQKLSRLIARFEAYNTLSFYLR